jgi:3-hydroxyisobutyrate dehydrogenase
MMGLRAGFIGLGSQGAPMARRIVDQGFPLTIWARRPQSVEPFLNTGAVVADTPAELAVTSDVVGICVVNDDDVRDVVLGGDGVLAGIGQGRTIVIHATIHPDTCRDIADAATAKGATVLDAPVSGGGIAAAEGRLLVMVGGEAEVLERCRPVLATFGDPIIHLGPLGSGEVAKVINNLVFTAHLGIAIDAYAFGERLHVDRAGLADVLRNGSGGSFAASVLSGRDGTGMGGAAALLRKNVDIVASLARERDIRPAELVAGIAEATLTTLTQRR